MTSVQISNAPGLTVLRSAALGSDLMAGALSALITLCYAVGYGSMIFSGSLARFLPYGMPAILISCAAVMLVIALTSSIRFSIGGPDANAVAILVGLTTGVASDIHMHGGTDATILVTVLVSIVLSSVVTGVVLYALGASKRGTMIQFLSFPVLGGFLAGTGYLILGGSFRMLTGESMRWSSLGKLVTLPWLQWLPAIVVCVTLIVLARRLKSVALLPIGMAVGIVLFYLGLYFNGVTIADAHRLGLLFEPEPLSALQLPVMWSRSEIDWSVLGAHVPEFMVVAMVSAITILLNVTGVGLVTGQDIDFNRELRAAGVANLVTAALGGIVGYQSLNRTLLNQRAGAVSRASGIAGAFACLAVIGLVPGIVAWFPKPVLVGLQLYLAYGLLNEWLVAAYRKLDLAEYLLIPVIVVVIAVLGPMSGVMLGVIATCVLFVVNYSRVSVVRSEFDATFHSNVERPIDDLRLLNERQRHVIGTCLQGYLFFGTANSLLRRVRERVDASFEAGTGLAHFVVLDFRLVNGLDASTSQSFQKLKRYCGEKHITLVLTSLPDPAKEMFVRGAVLSDMVQGFDSLDAGLEWMENQLLAALKPALSSQQEDLRSELKLHFGSETFTRLAKRLDAQELVAGEMLFAQGDTDHALYIVERGRLTVSLPLAGGKTLRLRSFGAGTMVGEMALYTNKPRSADVRADVPTLVRKLSLAALHQLEIEDPEVAGEFHRFVVNVLAARLAAANELVRASY